MKKILCLFISTLLMAFFLVSALSFEVRAQPELSVHNVETGEDFETIQQAINDPDTLAGHTISVGAGTYYENVVVNKSVSLVGEDKFNTTIDGGAVKTVVNITAEYAKLTGFTIQNGKPRYGIYVGQSSYGNRISHNIVRNNSIGIWLNASSGNVILGNNCTSNTFDGIFLKSSYNNALSGNIALNNDYGIWVELSGGNIVSGNTASKNRNTGFWVTQSSGNEFSGNTASNEPFGFWVEASYNNVFSGNMISCGQAAYGITFVNSDNNTVTGNTVSNNFVGMRLGVNSGDNMIFHNNFVDNNETLRGVLVNALDNDVEGNFWSDYNGTDDNKDGIGDTPYVINENNTDYYPLLGMFSDFSVSFEGEMRHVSTICNSTIFGVQHNSSVRIIAFNITGPDGTPGFCRIMIPKILVSYEPYVVWVDGEEVNATLLPASNISHAFLYFTYTLSTQKVTIISRPYYELLEKISSLSADLQNLTSTYNELQNAYESLSASYNIVLGNNTQLRETLDSLEAAYDSLLELYDSRARELDNMKNLMYAFMAATILGTVVLLPFGLKYYRMSNNQKKIIQAYSPFEIASVLFKTDVERRRAKIGKFAEKYGVKIQPRNTLEEVIRSVETKKKVKR